jgi:hypothetical protein
MRMTNLFRPYEQETQKTDALFTPMSFKKAEIEVTATRIFKIIDGTI